MRRVLLAMVCLLASAGVARAQTCFGGADAKMHVGADASFSSTTRNVAAGVGREFGQVFARGGFALVTSSELSAGKGFFGMGGVELGVGPNKRFQLCPNATFAKLWGLNIGPGDTSPTVLSFGASVGFEAKTVNTTRIVPTFGVYFNHMTQNLTGIAGLGGPGSSGSFGTSTAAIQFGAGFIFNSKMELVPSLGLQFGGGSTEAVFSVLFSLEVH